mmetsp:Transcript_8961/g.29608  ORF Transcript_8961/g.29608 Transcript_8961/m.29608 type:complete len:259 (-) Transcript_8961:14-790(-)
MTMPSSTSTNVWPLSATASCTRTGSLFTRSASATSERRSGAAHSTYFWSLSSTTLAGTTHSSPLVTSLKRTETTPVSNRFVPEIRTTAPPETAQLRGLTPCSCGARYSVTETPPPQKSRPLIARSTETTHGRGNAGATQTTPPSSPSDGATNVPTQQRAAGGASASSSGAGVKRTTMSSEGQSPPPRSRSCAPPALGRSGGSAAETRLGTKTKQPTVVSANFPTNASPSCRTARGATAAPSAASPSARAPSAAPEPHA